VALITSEVRSLHQRAQRHASNLYPSRCSRHKKTAAGTRGADGETEGKVETLNYFSDPPFISEPAEPEEAPVDPDAGAALLQSAGLSDTGHSLRPPRPSAAFCVLAESDEFLRVPAFFSAAIAGPTLTKAAIAAPIITFLILFFLQDCAGAAAPANKKPRQPTGGSSVRAGRNAKSLAAGLPDA
jgi:hypothetical protein